MNTNTWKLSSLRSKRRKEKKRKKTYGTYGVSLKEIIYACLESQKEKREKGAESLLKETMAGLP